jgi:formate hydrogenlyase subunit 5
MEILERDASAPAGSESFVDICRGRWADRVSPSLDERTGVCHIECRPEQLPEICAWLTSDLGFAFATVVAEERPVWSLTYVFYKDGGWTWIHVALHPSGRGLSVPSISGVAAAADWHEREIEDLFAIAFDGHPRLGEFILHEDWPEGTAPMRHAFDARQPLRAREPAPDWQPPTIVMAAGAFAMPIGPVFSDFAESAHFLLETVGEDVIHTIPRFFYKFRGLEKIAEDQPVERALLLAERFSGTSAFAHGLAFCQAVETICGITAPPRAEALRTVWAELERLRHHAAAITGICNSTALVVATSQAALIEEDLLRLSGELSRHRYLFGMIQPGGLACDLLPAQCRRLLDASVDIGGRLAELHQMLRYSSSFLDRLEEVGIVTPGDAASYSLVGPIARASGLARDIRRLFPYAAYAATEFAVPVEQEGDGYARLRILFREAEQSAAIIRQVLDQLPEGPVAAGPVMWRPGATLSAVEAPSGAAFHWLRVREDGIVARYRVTPPSFVNWHGFHFASENFAFQDFPIILASFGLSNAECDR